jgi:hypothetical protein
MPAHRSPGRALLAGLLVVLASVAMLVALVAGSVTTLTGPGFAGRTLRVVEAGGLRTAVIGTVTSHVLAITGDQAPVTPIVTQAVDEAFSSPLVKAELTAAARSLQSQLESGQARVLRLTLPGLGPRLGALVAARSPQLASVLDRLGTLQVVDVPLPPAASTAARELALLGRDSTLAILLCVALAAGALLISPARWGTLQGLGVGAIAAGLVAIGAYLVGANLIADSFSLPIAQTAARAAWDSYLGGLEPGGLALAGGGLAALVLGGAGRLLFRG